MLKVLFKIINKLKRKLYSSKGIPPGKISYSQCGEDLLVKYIFDLRGILSPTYLDIGANHPYFISNTALFYINGCRGINIEANPVFIANFKKLRPEDINISVGIGSHDTILDFYVINDPTLSSFSKTECQKYIETGKYHLTNTIKVKITTIQKILDKYNNGVFPDYFTIDTEGMDLEILKTIDYSQNAPKVICVEAADYSPIGAGERRTELIDFLVSKGYYEYASTNLNAIMVRRDFWFI
jgi:FkbM family methyltransferase